MGGGDKKEKTTIMVLKVDLQCPCCYKKAKKILCKMPRGKAIKSIEIKEPAKPKTPEKPKEPERPKGPEKPKDDEKPKGPEKSKVVTFEKPKEGEKPKEKAKEGEKPKGQEKPNVVDKPKDKPKDPEKPKDGPTAAMVATPWMSESMMMMPPVQGYPQVAHGCGCGQCYYTGGPCYQYYGTPVPSQPAPYYGNYSYGNGPVPGPSSYGKGCYVNNDYFNEENAQGCTIM